MRGENAASRRSFQGSSGNIVLRAKKNPRDQRVSRAFNPFAMSPSRLVILMLIAVLGAPGLIRPQEITSHNHERLRKGLQQFPEADTDKDGILTLSEGLAFLGKMKARGTEGEGYKDAPPPTLRDVSYGPHERNAMDFWRAKSAAPAPLVFFIHGGGFTSGDKSKASGKLIQQCLDAGAAFASINYRFRVHAPIQDILRDCARAVQFARSKAAEWNVDKARVASFGGSAGAGTSLWLAFHDDLADPASPDPVLRESTRLVCAGANATQCSYDALEWEKIFDAETTKRFADPLWPALYGFKSEAEARTPAGMRIMDDCDMCALISKDDPPVFLSTGLKGGPVADRGAYLHHPKHAERVRQSCIAAGVPVVADLPGLDIKPEAGQPSTLADFLFKHLQVHSPVSAQ